MRTEPNTVGVDVATVKGDMALLKWMAGFLLAFDVAFAFRYLFH